MGFYDGTDSGSGWGSSIGLFGSALAQAAAIAQGRQSDAIAQHIALSNQRNLQRAYPHVLAKMFQQQGLLPDPSPASSYPMSTDPNAPPQPINVTPLQAKADPTQPAGLLQPDQALLPLLQALPADKGIGAVVGLAQKATEPHGVDIKSGPGGVLYRFDKETGAFLGKAGDPLPMKMGAGDTLAFPPGTAPATANPAAAPPAAFSPAMANPGAASPAGASLSDYAARVAKAENPGGNPSQPNVWGGSTAIGNGQFINGTWLGLMKANHPELTTGKSDSDILAMRTNPALSNQMIQEYGAKNAGILAKAGMPVTTATLYLAHGFGTDGALKILQSAPNTPIANILPANVIAANPYLKNMTTGDVVKRFSQRVGNDQLTGGQGPADASPAAARPAAISPTGMPAQAPTGLHDLGGGWTGTTPAQQWRPMNADELRAHNAIAGSLIDTVTGQVQRATAYNSPSFLNASELNSQAASYNLTGKLPSGMGRGGVAAQQILAAADALVPDEIRSQGPNAIAGWRAANAQNYHTQTTILPQWNSAKPGTPGGNVVAINTAVNHFGLLTSLIGQLQNGSFQPTNSLALQFKTMFGKPAPTSFTAMRDIATDEAVRAVIGSGGSADDRKTAHDWIANAQSPEQMVGAIQRIQQLFGGRLSELQRSYENAFPGRKDFPNRLSPLARSLFTGNGASAPAQNTGGWSIKVIP